MRGGREIALQQRRVQKVLDTLAAENYMPAEAIKELQQAYVFLRNTEHAIQVYRDQQTQELPSESLPQSILAWVMGYTCWQDFSAALQQHRDQVDFHFRQLIAAEDEQEAADKSNGKWQALWLGELESADAIETLEAGGHEAADDVLKRLQHIRQQPAVVRMQAVARERLDDLIPMLLQALTDSEVTSAMPSAALLRILPLIEAVLRRTAYLLLLVENPGALRQLIILCAASPWIATQLAKHPVLLDELLDTRTLYQVPDKQALRDQLYQEMLRLPADDLEAQMEGLRYFKMAHQLHVSAAEVTAKLPLMKVSDYLTIIAEVILERVLELAWQDLTSRHGFPQKTAGVPCDKDFIVLGYGKMGGIELGHGSDLDLVFIHNAGANLATDGARSVDNGMFFARLGQRMIHILTAQTPSGMLYEVDMRLRPSGNSGLLVSSLQAFENYQRTQAWTWEQQALVRARVVAGDVALAESFQRLRCDLLCQPRDEVALKAEVVTMRQKMRDHLLPKDLELAEPPIFHLKHGTGAIVDIEFMVQYAVLAWSHQYPALAVYTDNIRILEALNSAGLFNAAETEALIDAYKAYRAHVHRLSLLQRPCEVPLAEFEQHRSAVISKWLDLMY
nr:bifunctional [glutamate--ammonia ligase]-adenylyl-L-tyrosine phosphorylase/[glutamate--ammonia-ligase] adenylyltransferase [Oceanicoccus sp. KOV_DT_Chl]